MLKVLGVVVSLALLLSVWVLFRMSSLNKDWQIEDSIQIKTLEAYEENRMRKKERKIYKRKDN